MARELKLLVIDDDPSVREYLRELLTPVGCHVTLIGDPLEGLSRLRTMEPFHILILDLRMPGMSGIELLERIRKFNKYIAAIILTAFPSLESATDAINLDCSAYMQKPFSGDEMRDTVARVARKKGIVVRLEDRVHVEVGRRIRQVREARELTLSQLGKRCNLSVSLLSEIERAELSPSLSSLFKISEALDTKIEEFIRGF